MLTVHTCIADLPVTHTPTVSAFTGTLRIINLCRRQAELWENHHSDISLTSLSPHYALALRLGKTLTTDFRICKPRAMKPKQVPLLNLINGHKYCNCTVSYFFTPIRHRFSPKLYRRWVLIQIHDWSCHMIDQCQIFHAPKVLNDWPVTTLSTLLTIRNKCPKAGRTIRSRITRIRFLTTAVRWEFSLLRLKQNSRLWYTKLRSYVVSLEVNVLRSVMR